MKNKTNIILKDDKIFFLVFFFIIYLFIIKTIYIKYFGLIVMVNFYKIRFKLLNIIINILIILLYIYIKV